MVAGDKNLREQHFRIKDGNLAQNCNVIIEGKTSVNSKIVLKCWLDDKLKAADIESRVPIHTVDNINRGYEFSFLSKSRRKALSYCHERINLSDEKLAVLENNSQGIHIIYVVDQKNGGCEGQYPEGLMKVQHRQGYCLLLAADSADYNEAGMKAVFYAQLSDTVRKSSSVHKYNTTDYYEIDPSFGDKEDLKVTDLIVREELTPSTFWGS